jgi:hypothetical protein
MFIIYLVLSKSFDIKTRDRNKRTNLGKIYLDNMYIPTTIIVRAKNISFIK